MVSSHMSLPGLTIATHQIKLWLSLATTLPSSNSIFLINRKTQKLRKPITVVAPKTLVMKIKGHLRSPTSVHPPLSKSLETQEVDCQDRQSHQKYKFPFQNVGIAKQ